MPERDPMADFPATERDPCGFLVFRIRFDSWLVAIATILFSVGLCTAST